MGLERTLFHRIRIPIAPGLVYVSEETELVIEWINLRLADPMALDGVESAMGRTPDVEASIYLGGAHNWYEIEKLTLAREGTCYRIVGEGTILFSREGVGEDEQFTFETRAMHRGAA